MQVLDNALRHNPNVIFPGDFVVVGGGQDMGGLLPGRIKQHHPRFAVNQLEKIVRFGDQDRAQYRELKGVLHVGDPFTDSLDEIVVSCDLRGNHAELVPFVPLEDAQHRGSLMFQRRCQLQLQVTLRGSLKTEIRGVSLNRNLHGREFTVIFKDFSISNIFNRRWPLFEFCMK